MGGAHAEVGDPPEAEDEGKLLAPIGDLSKTLHSAALTALTEVKQRLRERQQDGNRTARQADLQVHVCGKQERERHSPSGRSPGACLRKTGTETAQPVRQISRFMSAENRNGNGAARQADLQVHVCGKQERERHSPSGRSPGARLRKTGTETAQPVRQISRFMSAENRNGNGTVRQADLQVHVCGKQERERHSPSGRSPGSCLRKTGTGTAQPVRQISRFMCAENRNGNGAVCKKELLIPACEMSHRVIWLNRETTPELLPLFAHMHIIYKCTYTAQYQVIIHYIKTLQSPYNWSTYWQYPYWPDQGASGIHSSLRPLSGS